MGVSMTRCGPNSCALVLGHFFAHDEDVAVAAHFLGHRLVQRLPDGHFHHFDTGGEIRVGSGFEFRGSNSGRG
eukprot:gene41261-55807_t